MTITTGRSLLSFRNEWLEAVVARCQSFVGVVMLPDDRQSIPELATLFVNALPDSQVHAEDLALCMLLMNVATKWGASLHHHAHVRPARKPCSFDPQHMLDPFLRDRCPSAKDRFLEWARAFSLEFSRTHPVSAAHRAAAVVRERPCERWDVVTLANVIGVSPRQLSREFRQTLGITLAKYVRHERLQRALELLMDQPGKIEPVALQVGYASKKNFYRVFKKSIGMTPTAFLRLPSAATRDVIAAARNPGP